MTFLLFLFLRVLLQIAIVILQACMHAFQACSRKTHCTLVRLQGDTLSGCRVPPLSLSLLDLRLSAILSWDGAAMGPGMLVNFLLGRVTAPSVPCKGAFELTLLAGMPDIGRGLMLARAEKCCRLGAGVLGEGLRGTHGRV